MFLACDKSTHPTGWAVFFAMWWKRKVGLASCKCLCRSEQLHSFRLKCFCQISSWCEQVITESMASSFCKSFLITKKFNILFSIHTHSNPITYTYGVAKSFPIIVSEPNKTDLWPILDHDPPVHLQPNIHSRFYTSTPQMRSEDPWLSDSHGDSSCLIYVSLHQGDNC